MADLEVGNPFGLNIPAGNNVGQTYPNPNLVSIEAMKAALQDFDDDTYTDEKLLTMTYNDLVYAVKINDLTELPEEEET